VQLFATLPKSGAAQVLGRQMLRSGTSVGAHYRKAMRARSDAEYVSKIEVGLQEIEETGYWLELLAGTAIVPPKRLAPLMNETDQLTAIFVTCVKRAKGRRKTRMKAETER
jgi:four helix bundle protein